jgi:anti-sigma regulatory factor (Ser/Thr protein kinase)
MNILSTDILALSSEAALLARQGTVYYANSAASQLLGKCNGRSLNDIFGPDITEVQASAFITDYNISGYHYTIRVNRFDDGQIIFLQPCDNSPLLLNDALIYAIRNSLMNLNISVDTLRNRAEALGDSQQLSHLNSITHSSYKMMRVIGNASVVLAANNGNVVFSPEEMNVKEFVANLIDTVQTLCPHIELRLSYGDIHTLVADAAMVELIVLNLISNCFSHAANCQRVSINLTETRDSLIISVDDDGCGIAPELLGTVFDRYCHGFDLSNMLSGAGLGLAATRAAANLHCGTLLLESRQGHGTTVRVSLSRHVELAKLYTPQKHWESSMHSILTGLASCLPDELYTEVYLD